MADIAGFSQKTNRIVGFATQPVEGMEVKV
jgi:hypothetical protein